MAVGVVVIGSVTVDRQFKRGRFIGQRLGGVPTYAGATFVRAGLSCTAVANIGGAYRDPALQVLDRLGVRLLAGASPGMTVFSNFISSDGERRQELAATAPCISSELLPPDLLGLASIIHVGPVHPNDVCVEVLRTLRGCRATVSLDIQGYVRSGSLGAVTARVSSDLSLALAAAAIVKGTEDELGLILDDQGLDHRGLMKRFGIRELIITRGRRGGTVLAASGRAWPYAALPTGGEESDSTGAGDVFMAMYVSARLIRGHGVSEACEEAAMLAGRQVSGGFLTQADLEIGQRG